MVKIRRHRGINCVTCPVAHLCIADGLNSAEKIKLNAVFNNVHIISAGQHLYYQNQKLQHLFAVYSGCCKEYVVNEEGYERINNFYFPGDLLALESLPAKKYSFCAQALADSQLCAIPCESFFQLMRDMPNLLQRFINIASYKLLEQQNIPITTDAKCRIAAFLLTIFYRLRQRNIILNYIKLPMSQFDISHFLGLAHETVSRVLHSFQKDNLISVLHKDIYLTNVSALKNIAQWRE